MAAGYYPETDHMANSSYRNMSEWADAQKQRDAMNATIRPQTPQQDPTEGRKYDSNKPDYTMLPWDAVEQVVQVLDYGAKKYARDNWRYVDDATTRYMAAALRHMSAYLQGEELDPESGINHLAHACCSLLFVLALTGDDK